MLKIIALIATLISVAACQSTNSNSGNTSSTATRNAIPENNIREIYNNCLANTTISAAQNYCTCIARAIGQQLSVEQLVEAGQSGASPAGKLVQQLRGQCLAQVNGAR